MISIDAINRLPLVITVVVGTKGENLTRDYPTNVRLSTAESGLPMETVFLCFQLRSLDPNRFLGPPAGKVSGAGGGGFMMFYVPPEQRMSVVRALASFEGQVSNCHFTKHGAQAWRP